MGTEVLRPNTCLIRPPQPSFNHHPRRKTLAGNNNHRSHRRKRSDPPISRRSASFDDHHVITDPPRHVTILRRGQSIGDLNNLSLSPSRADVYAGSAVDTSPSPRALPLPSFFSKKLSLSPSRVEDDSATREIRRLLRLE